MLGTAQPLLCETPKGGEPPAPLPLTPLRFSGTALAALPSLPPSGPKLLGAKSLNQPPSPPPPRPCGTPEPGGALLEGQLRAAQQGAGAVLILWIEARGDEALAAARHGGGTAAHLGGTQGGTVLWGGEQPRSGTPLSTPVPRDARGQPERTQEHLLTGQ